MITITGRDIRVCNRIGPVFTTNDPAIALRWADENSASLGDLTIHEVTTMERSREIGRVLQERAA